MAWLVLTARRGPVPVGPRASGSWGFDARAHLQSRCCGANDGLFRTRKSRREGRDTSMGACTARPVARGTRGRGTARTVPPRVGRGLSGWDELSLSRGRGWRGSRAVPYGDASGHHPAGFPARVACYAVGPAYAPSGCSRRRRKRECGRECVARIQFSHAVY